MNMQKPSHCEGSGKRLVGEDALAGFPDRIKKPVQAPVAPANTSIGSVPQAPAKPKRRVFGEDALAGM